MKKNVKIVQQLGLRQTHAWASAAAIIHNDGLPQSMHQRVHPSCFVFLVSEILDRTARRRQWRANQQESDQLCGVATGKKNCWQKRGSHFQAAAFLAFDISSWRALLAS